jgi:hypothetical protein
MDASSGSSNGFVDLNAYENIRATSSHVRSSVIKSTVIKDAGVAKIEIIDGEKGSPAIQVQREGDKIKQIEFICPCGKSAHLDLEYDEE